MNPDSPSPQPEQLPPQSFAEMKQAFHDDVCALDGRAMPEALFERYKVLSMIQRACAMGEKFEEVRGLSLADLLCLVEGLEGLEKYQRAKRDGTRHVRESLHESMDTLLWKELNELAATPTAPHPMEAPLEEVKVTVLLHLPVEAPEPSALQLVPETMIQMYQVLPLMLRGGVLTVALPEGSDVSPVQDLALLLSLKEIAVVYLPLANIQSMLEEYDRSVPKTSLLDIFEEPEHDQNDEEGKGE